MGEFSASWARITDPVSTTTRVCAYDRAGQGWSDDVASPQDGVTAAAGPARPAGRGRRARTVRAGRALHRRPLRHDLRRDQYPEQVAGMVLLDSSSPHQFTAVPAYPTQYALMRRGLRCPAHAGARRASGHSLARLPAA